MNTETKNALQKVLTYLTVDMGEEKNYEESDYAKNHIYNDIVKLQSWLDNYVPSNKHLNEDDLEAIEKLITRAHDDIAIGISRSFERLQIRIDAIEARLHSRLGDVEEKVCDCRQDIIDVIGVAHDIDGNRITKK